jgi:hypothetical protein
MENQEQEQLLKRLKYRRLSLDDFASDKTLIVEKELVLSDENKDFKPKIFKPASVEDLMMAIGPRPEARAKAKGCCFEMQVEQLRRMEQEVRKTSRQMNQAERRREKDEAIYSHLLMRAVINGAVPVEEIQKLPRYAEIVGQITSIPILRWVWPNIVVRAGATLIFNGAAPQTVHAYKLTVEPGASIVLNRASVTFDCVILEVQ